MGYKNNFDKDYEDNKSHLRNKERNYRKTEEEEDYGDWAYKEKVNQRRANKKRDKEKYDYFDEDKWN